MSNESQPDNRNGSSPQTKLEAWQLTAYVLGELEEAEANRIRSLAEQDARVMAELASIGQTLNQVAQVYAAQDAPLARSHAEQQAAEAERQQRLQALLVEASQTQAPAPPLAEAQPRQRTESDERSKSRQRWIGLLAMAASLFLAVGLAIPSLTDGWFVEPMAMKPSLPNSPEAAPWELEADSVSQPGRQEDPGVSVEALSVDGAFTLEGPAESMPSTIPGLPSVAPNAGNLPYAPAGQTPAEARGFPSLPPVASAGAGGVPAIAPEPYAVPSNQNPPATIAPPARPATADSNGSVQLEAKLLGQNSGDAVAEAEVANANAMGMGMGMGGYGGSYAGDGYGGAGYGGGYGGAYGGGYGGGGYGGEAAGYGMGGMAYGGSGYGGSNMMGEGMMGEGMMGGYGDESRAPGQPLNRKQRFRKRVVPQSSMPGFGSGDRFDSLFENPFVSVESSQLSTFSIDVDTASYAKSRQLLLEARQLPPPGAVRIEEFVNYFDYEYTGPSEADEPFGTHLAVSACPWNPEHQLVRIALQAEKLDLANRPAANIVFLLDVSGSMDAPNKLPLVKETMRMVINQLGENDRIAMVVYAGAAGCILEGTPGDQQNKIHEALNRLKAGGSTNGGQGIQLAYELARDQFIEGGINRVILCTDGDFNVGVTHTQALVELVEENARSQVFLTVLGYGMGNTNDAMMEQISNRGNGVYGFVDNRREAHRQMVKQLAGNLLTVAKDVKVQVEFNPNKVRQYRLLGYENRMLKARDFDDDTKDAGEIGAGHRVTALYEIVPVASPRRAAKEDLPPLRYQPATSPASEQDQPSEGDASGGVEGGDSLATELLAVNLRYKQPDSDTSRLLVYPLVDETVDYEQTDRDFRWAAAMVEFGLLLRQSRYSGQADWGALLERARSAAGVGPDADRQECLEMIRQAATLSGR